MDVLLVTENKLRFSGIRNQACLTITATLFGAHPILSLFAGFCTNVGESVAIDLPCTSLTSHKMHPLVRCFMCSCSVRYDLTVLNTIKLVGNSVVFICKNGTENWLQNRNIKKYADLWWETCAIEFNRKKDHEISIVKVVCVGAMKQFRSQYASLFNKLTIIGWMIMLIFNTNSIFVFVRDYFGLAMAGTHLRASPIRSHRIASVTYKRKSFHHELRRTSLARHEHYVLHVTYRIRWKSQNIEID